MTTVLAVFTRCVRAVAEGLLVQRESSTDKEFHFQNWFEARLRDLRLNFDVGGRNSYPDFRMVKQTEGYELKGLAYPGRDASFDSNSQVPSGHHNVIDLVVCHGDLLNADHEYIHENKSVKGFGTYGDILVRDRKMYVVPTPHRLLHGVAHCHTLILPAETEVGDEFVEVGQLCRREASDIIVGYSFDLQTNELQVTSMPNPDAGREHLFRAWRLAGSPAVPVLMREGQEAVDVDVETDE